MLFDLFGLGKKKEEPAVPTVAKVWPKYRVVATGDPHGITVFDPDGNKVRACTGLLYEATAGDPYGTLHLTISNVKVDIQVPMENVNKEVN